MSAPWADLPVSEWCIAQLRNGFRANSPAEAPGVATLGAEGGVISSRDWFNWRNANAVTVYGLQYTRELLKKLNQAGLSPAHTWLSQTWQATSRYRAGRETFMDPYGFTNACQLEHTVKLTARPDSFDLYGLENVIGPRVPDQPVWTLAGSKGWLIGFVDPDSDTPKLTVTSPGYYCRYRRATPPSNFMSRNWPLDPANEREPAIYDQDPRALPRRSTVPAVAETVVANTAGWGRFLGFTLGPTPEGQWRKSSPSHRKYTLEIPVDVTASREEIYDRARPYEGAVIVAKGARDASVPGVHTRTRLLEFNARHGFSAWITDPGADGRFVLTVESAAYRG